MPLIAPSRRGIVSGLTGVIASAMLAGCATHAAPGATVSAADARAAIAGGKHARAVKYAEATVEAEPRNAEYRAMLGDAYLDAGRFVSASNAFSDAFALGNRSPGTALSYALSLAGAGLHNEALAVLRTYEDEIPAADLGLAITLAGSPESGIRILEDSIRAGSSSAKLRQNLAYSYALAGRWRHARVMAAQDLRPDLVDQRLEEWNRAASPLAWQQRIALLLDVPAGVRDPGQPEQLALANNPSLEQLAAEALAAAPRPAPMRTADDRPAIEPAAAAQPIPGEPQPTLAVDASPLQFELPAMLAVAAIGPATSIPATATFLAAPDLSGAAPIGPASAAMAIESAFDAAFSVRNQPKRSNLADAGNTPSSLPSHAPATAAVARSAAPARKTDDTHLVQLGSFASRESAERSQSIFIARHPELSRHRMVITEAVVGGKRYWRVSAAGFDASASRAMCGTMQARGDGCLAYAAGNPIPGAVRSGVMLARR